LNLFFPLVVRRHFFDIVKTLAETRADSPAIIVRIYTPDALLRLMRRYGRHSADGIAIANFPFIAVV
jgi:hypothetical protein